MNWPTSQDYNEAIQNAATTISDPDLKAGEVTLNAMGLPVPRSGNFADVYQVKGADGRMWAVKCFTRHVEGLQERYTKINQYLERAQLPFTVGFSYLADGLRIRGKWYPLLKMEWVEGFTLNEFVRQNADKPNCLHGLMQMWAKLSAKLRDANIAHADLQHGNVLLVPGNTPAKLGLKLIDYDGMWVPPLADYHSGEVGHPNFQHPLRLKERLFNADVDRFAHLVIACALRSTVVGGKPLWDKFDNGDNLLFREQDLRDPEKSPIFKSLWDLNDSIVRTLLGNIALSSKQPLRKTPWLDDLLLEEGGPRLSPEQEKQAAAMLGVAPPAAKAPAAQSLPVEFTEFDAIDDEDDKQRALPLREEDDEDRERRGRRRSKQTTKATKQKKNAKLPLMIGGGVGALALIVVVLALTLGGGRRNVTKDQEPDKLAQENDGQEKPKRTKPLEKSVEPNDAGTAKGAVTEPKGPGPPKPERPKGDKQADVPPPIPIADDGSVYRAPEFLWRNPIVGLATVPGAKSYLLFGRDDPALYLVDDNSKTPREIGKHGGPIRSIACSPDGSTAVTGGADAFLRVWPLPIGHFPKITDFMDAYGYTAFHDSVVVHQNATGKEEVVPTGKPGSELKMFKKFYDEKSLGPMLGQANTEEVEIFGGDMRAQVFEGGVILFDRGSRKLWAHFHGRRKPVPEKCALKEHTRAVVACAISRDGMRAVSVGEDNLLCVWDLSERKRLAGFAVPSAMSVAFLAERNKVLLGTANQSAGIWDLEKQQRVTELAGHTGSVRAVCVSHDGKIGVTGGDDGVIRVWDLASGKLRLPLPNPPHLGKDPIVSMSMMPDGRFLASAHGAMGRQTWDVQAGRPMNGGIAGEKQPLLCISLFTFNSGQSYVCGSETGTGGKLESFKTGIIVVKAPPTVAIKDRTEIRGGAPHRDEFREATDAGLLVGLEVGVGKIRKVDVIRTLRPIYRDGDNETSGKQMGKENAVVVKAIARPGYAVGAITVKNATVAEGLSLTFMKVVNGKLDRSDFYESEWIGGLGGLVKTTLGGDGRPVIGIIGKTDPMGNVSGIGLALK